LRFALIRISSNPHPMHFILRLGIGLIALAALLGASSAAGTTAQSNPYHVADTFQVGGTGFWDYLTVDSEHKLIYVPRSTHTLVLKEETGASVADIPGQKRNHGVVLVPSAGRGFITDGEEGSVTVFDLRTHAVLGQIKAADDADGVIYDPATNKVLVVCGDAGVLVPISPNVEPKTGAADPAIELGGKPEFLAADGRGKVFVNLVNKDQVAVVDLKTAKVEAHWSTAPGGAPVGMAIDPEHRRIFVGCRKPQKLLVMDCDSGKVLADLPIGRGVDAVAFDDGYALASCGDGTLTVVGEKAGKFEVVETVATKPGARTCGLDPRTHTLYLPTAEFEASTGQGWPKAKPDSFVIVKVTR
jgi:DNA-binding beta-propeller fold protein YncE